MDEADGAGADGAGADDEVHHSDPVGPAGSRGGGHPVPCPREGTRGHRPQENRERARRRPIAGLQPPGSADLPPATMSLGISGLKELMKRMPLLSETQTP